MEAQVVLDCPTEARASVAPGFKLVRRIKRRVPSLTLELPGDTGRMLKELADAAGISMNAWLRAMIRQEHAKLVTARAKAQRLALRDARLAQLASGKRRSKAGFRPKAQ